jgi:uncharacterized RDD family membrane protein YckC
MDTKGAPSGQARVRPGATYKANVMNRLIAGIVDVLILGVIMVFLYLIPVYGKLISVVVGALFWLTRDYFPVGGGHRSIGKRLAKLRVEKQGTGTAECSLADSAKRNLPASLAILLTLIPLVGKFLGPLIFCVLGVVETLLIFTDPEGLRLGDKIAETKVLD